MIHDSLEEQTLWNEFIYIKEFTNSVNHSKIATATESHLRGQEPGSCLGHEARCLSSWSNLMLAFSHGGMATWKMLSPEDWVAQQSQSGSESLKISLVHDSRLGTWL